ncbi:MAG: ABC transporter substrate-binding protein [Burkholderiales bacterium]
MNRRKVVLALAALLTATQLAHAQQRSVRVGALVGRKISIFWPPIIKRLGELGYVEGKNLVLEYRSADGVSERFATLARELIDAKCDLIFAIGAEQAARALIDAKSPVPTVIIANDYDPVKSGIVASLRRPGGNVTGIGVTQLELAAKRMEIMHEMLPAARRYLALGDTFSKDQLDAVVQAGRRLGVEVVAETFGAPPYDIEAVLTKYRQQRIDALMLTSSPHLADLRVRISATALKLGLAVSTPNLWDDALSFVLNFAPDQPKLAARAADIAVSLLRGAKAAETPVENPTVYNLVINLRTAKALNIKVPQSLLLRADRVID